MIARYLASLGDLFLFLASLSGRVSVEESGSMVPGNKEDFSQMWQNHANHRTNLVLYRNWLFSIPLKILLIIFN